MGKGPSRGGKLLDLDQVGVACLEPVHLIAVGRERYHVRGVGEVPIVPPMAAVANAIHAATGMRLRDLPMSPPKILAEIDAEEPRRLAAE